MACKKCEWYQRKLSPLEDKEFTAKYRAREPLAWIGKQTIKRNGQLYIMFQLPHLWKATFKADAPDRTALARLGRTLDALGWERTRASGVLHFRMKAEEFQEYA